jgi:glycogen(starch) synthase
VSPRRISVVINTYNRAESLALTLEALECLDHPDFEVVVINGPSMDDTESVLAGYSGRIKVGSCANRNLSESRNLGIRLASGEIVAFIDDDAYPDPAWLDALDAAYDWGEVAAAGGPVFGHTGYAWQVFHNTANRFGDGTTMYPPCLNPTQLLSSPGSMEFVYTIGTNSSFRRERLAAIGGFDEEFEYYLDETDVCCRLNDSGWVVAALDEGFVYHKFLASDIRDRKDVIRDWYQVMKSRFYFGLRHGLPRTSFADLCAAQSAFVDHIRANVELNLEAGVHQPAIGVKFEDDVRRASDLALERWMSGSDKRRPPDWFDLDDQPYLRFPTRRPVAEKLHICFLSQEYPPVPLNGIGRVIHSLARALAAEGHVIRVLTRGEGHHRVDLEEGVWVHRMVDQSHETPADLAVPHVIWDHSATLHDELERIDAMRPIDVVQTPNWDSEGVATLLDGRLPVVVGLYTPVHTVIRTDPVMQASVERDEKHLPQLIGLERLLYQRAAGYLACGPAIVEEIESAYDVDIPTERTGLVAHGLPDMSVGVSGRDPGDNRGARTADGDTACRILFVGRLEGRKGADVLLDAIVRLIDRGSDVTLSLIGDDTLHTPSGRTLHQEFEHDHPELADRVSFLGRVDDDTLKLHYAQADVFVAPSRFESFGLMLLEAMMFAVPIVCTDIGGMREIIDGSGAGLLVPPDDPAALAAAIGELVSDGDLRVRMGGKGRLVFEQRFSDRAMAADVERLYRDVVRRTQAVSTGT